MKSDPNYFFRYAKKFSVCVSDIVPLYDKKRNLLTSDKLEVCTVLLKQFNSVCTTPLPNKQVTDPESLFSVESITSQDDEVFLTNIIITESLIIASIKFCCRSIWNSCFPIVELCLRISTIPLDPV